MKTKKVLIPIFCAILIFANCSKKASTAVVDDTLEKTPHDSAIITLDSSSNIRMTFKKVTASSGKDLWVSVTEVTQEQYKAIMKTSELITVSNAPKSVNWYDAATCANKMTEYVNSFQYSTLYPINAVYTPNDTIKSFKPPRIRIATYIVLAGDSLKDTTGILLHQKTLDSVLVIRNKVFDLSMGSGTAAQIRTTVINALLSLEPDSLFISERTTPRSVYPHSLGKAGLQILLDSLAKNGIGLTAYKHAYRFKGDSKLYNAPLIPQFSPITDVIVSTGVLTLDSTTRTGHLLYFSTTPPESLLSKTQAWVYGYPSPDTLLDSPRTLFAKVWTSDLSKYGFRLPTVDEWETIARCGTNINYSTYNGKLSPQGAVYGQTGAQPVASVQANPWGFFDMTGNLFEWTNDWWDNNGQYTTTLPYSTQMPLKTAKGGCFKNPDSDGRFNLNVNYSALPDSTDKETIGFRLVAPPDDSLWSHF